MNDRVRCALQAAEEIIAAEHTKQASWFARREPPATAPVAQTSILDGTAPYHHRAELNDALLLIREALLFDDTIDA